MANVHKPGLRNQGLPPCSPETPPSLQRRSPRTWSPLQASPSNQPRTRLVLVRGRPFPSIFRSPEDEGKREASTSKEMGVSDCFDHPVKFWPTPFHECSYGQTQISREYTSGMTLPTAFAAPVDAGMMLAEAQRPARLTEYVNEHSMGV